MPGSDKEQHGATLSGTEQQAAEEISDDEDTQPDDNAPDWSRDCEVCGARPVVPVTGMCGPCTFGDASTAGGNW